MGNLVKVLLGVAAVIVIALGIWWVTGTKVDDQKLIAKALDDAVEAGRQGRPGGVLENLSFNISVNGTDYSGQQRQIGDFIKKNNPDVSFENKRAVVTENEATIVTPAVIKLSLLGNNMQRHVDNVTLIFRKEDDREWLIFPTRRWKLAQMRIPDTAIADFISGG